MTAIAFAIASGSDVALSDDARVLYKEKLRGLVESSSLAATGRSELLGEVARVAQTSSAANWDGEGALAVEQATLKYATRFLLALPTGRANPTVLVDRDGAIAFDWGEDPNRTFTVSVGRDGTLTYAGYFDGAQNWGYETLADQIPLNILVYIDRAAR